MENGYECIEITPMSKYCRVDLERLVIKMEEKIVLPTVDQILASLPGTTPREKIELWLDYEGEEEDQIVNMEMEDSDSSTSSTHSIFGFRKMEEEEEEAKFHGLIKGNNLDTSNEAGEDDSNMS
jgi:hypothetical protein